MLNRWQTTLPEGSEENTNGHLIDSETVLFLQDFEGDENFHLWAMDVTATDTVARQSLEFN